MARRCLVMDSRSLQDIQRDGPALRLQVKGRSRQWFPLRRLSRVLCIGYPALGLGALGETAHDGVPVTFLQPGGEVLAQLVYPGALPAPLNHWLDAAATEPDIAAAYALWADNLGRHTYGLAGAVACDRQHAAARAEALLAELLRKQKRGRLPAHARSWFSSLLMTGIQAELMARGMPANSRVLQTIVNDMLHPGLMLVLSWLYLNLPVGENPRETELVRYYQRHLESDVEAWIQRGVYSLEQQLESAGMIQDAVQKSRQHSHSHHSSHSGGRRYA